MKLLKSAVWAAAALSATASLARAQPPAPAGGPASWAIDGIVVVATALIVGICVLLHYEGLNFLLRKLNRMQGRLRRRVLFGIFGVLSVHIAEIWIFGIAYALLLVASPDFGSVHGISEPSLLDHVYFSAMTFTTVGFGDVYPKGPVRFMAGTEALTGLVLITWSASFTFLEMSRFWRDR